MTSTTRTRTSLDAVADDGEALTVYCNSSEVSVAKSVGLTRGIDKITTDVVTPNFYALQKRGKIVNNPFYSKTVEHGYTCPGFFVSRTNTCSPSTATKSQSTTGAFFYGTAAAYPYGNIQNTHDFYGDGPLRSDAFLSEFSNLSGQIQTRCLGNIVPADVEGLVFLAEWKKTIALVKNPLAGIRKFLKDVRRSRRYKRSSAPSLGKYLADEWLRYRYGLTPLVMDFEGALQASIAPRFGMRVTARSSGTTSGDYTKTTSNVASPYFYTVTTECEGTVEGSVRAGVLYEHTFNVNNSYGLGLENIPSAIWEVIPYSFIVDWFVNAGDWIKASTPKADVKILAEWTTTEIVESTTVSHSYVSKNVANFAYGGDPAGTSTRVVTEKTRSPGVSASFVSKLPSINFEAPRDWIHLGDSIALIASSLKYR